MQKVGIVTLYGNSNFGNKLQNYAIQKKVSSLGFDVVTLRTYNSTAKYFPFIENRFKYLLKNISFKVNKGEKVRIGNSYVVAITNNPNKQTSALDTLPPAVY